MGKIVLCILLTIVLLKGIYFKDKIFDDNNEKFYKKCIHPTIMVCNQESSVGGSGFIVKSKNKGFIWQNVILGAAHTILDNKNLVVKVPQYKNTTNFRGYKTYDLAVYAINLEADIFIGVFTSFEEMPIVDLNLDPDLNLRTKVLHVGFGLFDDVRFDSGEITQTYTVDPFPFRGMIRTNAFTFSGDSGGPLFLEEDFKVVGICHGIRKKNDTPLPQISFFKPLKEFFSWNSNLNYSLDWVYKTSEPLPVFPFLELNLQKYEFIPPR